MRQATLLLTLTASLLLAGGIWANGTPSAHWRVIGGGGGHVEAPPYALDGTIGQVVVGAVSNIPYDLCSGFWCGSEAEYIPSYYLYLPLALRNY